VIIDLNYENIEKESTKIKILIKLGLDGEELRDFSKAQSVIKV